MLMRTQNGMLRTLHVPALFGYLLLFLGCASTEATFYDKERVSRIKSWEIVYSSELAGDEPTTWVQDRTVSATRNRTAQINLHLADAIFFRLKERYNVRMIREAGVAEGQIRLHAVNFTKYFYEYKPLRNLNEIRKDNFGSQERD